MCFTVVPVNKENTKTNMVRQTLREEAGELLLFVLLTPMMKHN